MSDDLVKRLREYNGLADSALSDNERKDAADRIEELEAKLAKAVSALELIAQPRVGPDFDWSHEEVSRWRDGWYRKYQNIARSTLAELTGGQDDRCT